MIHCYPIPIIFTNFLHFIPSSAFLSLSALIKVEVSDCSFHIYASWSKRKERVAVGAVVDKHTCVEVGPIIQRRTASEQKWLQRVLPTVMVISKSTTASAFYGNNRIEVQSMYSTQLFRIASATLKLARSFQAGYRLRNSKTSQGGSTRTYCRCPSPSISTAPCLPRGIGPKQSRSTLQITRRWAQSPVPEGFYLSQGDRRLL